MNSFQKIYVSHRPEYIISKNVLTSVIESDEFLNTIVTLILGTAVFRKKYLVNYLINKQTKYRSF